MIFIYIDVCKNFDCYPIINKNTYTNSKNRGNQLKNLIKKNPK